MSVIDSTYELSPLFRASRSQEPGSRLLLFSGSGSKRETLRVDSSDLLVWLLTLNQPRSRHELEKDLAQYLRVDISETAGMLRLLINSQVLIPRAIAEQYRSKGRRWEQWGWRDAFDFHCATTGLQFDKLYDSDLYRIVLEGFLADDSCGPQPQPFKDVQGDLTVSLKPLLGVHQHGTASVEDALLANVPINYFTESGGIELGEVAEIIVRAFGVQRMVNLILGPHQQKSYPSGGARHPMELYLASREVTGLEAGIYYFHPYACELRRVNGQDALARLDDTGFGKRGVRTAPAIVFLTTRWIRHSWKYRYSRSYRMILMEAGHAVQAIRLAGSALGVNVYYAPAVNETLVNAMLGEPDEWREAPLCMLAFGKGGVM